MDRDFFWLTGTIDREVVNEKKNDRIDYCRSNVCLQNQSGKVVINNCAS